MKKFIGILLGLLFGGGIITIIAINITININPPNPIIPPIQMVIMVLLLQLPSLRLSQESEKPLVGFENGLKLLVAGF